MLDRLVVFLEIHALDRTDTADRETIGSQFHVPERIQDLIGRFRSVIDRFFDLFDIEEDQILLIDVSDGFLPVIGQDTVIGIEFSVDDRIRRLDLVPIADLFQDSDGQILLIMGTETSCIEDILAVCGLVDVRIPGDRRAVKDVVVVVFDETRLDRVVVRERAVAVVGKLVDRIGDRSDLGSPVRVRGVSEGGSQQ